MQGSDVPCCNICIYFGINNFCCQDLNFLWAFSQIYHYQLILGRFGSSRQKLVFKIWIFLSSFCSTVSLYAVELPTPSPSLFPCQGPRRTFNTIGGVKQQLLFPLNLPFSGLVSLYFTIVWRCFCLKAAVVLCVLFVTFIYGRYSIFTILTKIQNKALKY